MTASARMTDAEAMAEILGFLPHRPPFLFADRVEIEGESIFGYRLWRPEEDFFRGHFPEYPVVPGVILAAAYMLRVLQRVAWGGTNNPKHHDLHDLDFREIVTLSPLLVFVLLIGLHPQPFVHAMHATVLHLLEQVGRTLPHAVAALP